MFFDLPHTHAAPSSNMTKGAPRVVAHQTETALSPTVPDAVQARSTGQEPMMQRSFSEPLVSSAKLHLGRRDDPYEKEADAVADRVVADQSLPPTSGMDPLSPPVARASAPTLQCDNEDFIEVELVPNPPEESGQAEELGIELPEVSGDTWQAIGGTPYAELLPGYSQAGDTCGAASLVSALLIWDREHWRPDAPNERLVNACNFILSAFDEHGADAIDRWTENPTKKIRRKCGKDPVCIRQTYTVLHNNFLVALPRTRAAAEQPGARVSQVDYQNIAYGIYFLWRDGTGAGLTALDIENIQATLGLQEPGSGVDSNISSFDEIFSHPSIVGLGADRIAQVTWLVRSGQHAFLVGRLQTGEWFWSDQGTRPATEIRAASLMDLSREVRAAAAAGYWVFLGDHLAYQQYSGFSPSWTGILPLGDQESVNRAFHNLVPLGAFLGEVDAGYLIDGSRLECTTRLGEARSLAAAQALFPSTARGSGLVVEEPAGVFQVYAASAVGADNVGQTALDEVDSKGGLLRRHDFTGAWLQLGTATGQRGEWFAL